MTSSGGREEEIERRVGPIVSYEVYPFPFDIPYFLGVLKLYEAHQLANSARFALFNAWRDDHDMSSPQGVLWVRSHYWGNAVLMYNSISDLLGQSLWLALGLHTADMETDPHWLQFALGTYSPNTLAKRLKARQSKVALPLFDSYTQDPTVKKIREWANTMKHHGTFDWEGLDMYRWGIGLDYKGKFSMEDILPPRMNLDASIDVLIDLQRPLRAALTDFAEFLSDENYHGPSHALRFGPRQGFVV